MTDIENNIKINYNILKRIEILSARVRIAGNNKRNTLFAGFFRNALSHFYAIALLSEKKLYSSSFALVRILFENAVRAKYMYEKFDNQKIEKLYSNQNWDSWKAFPGVKKMSAEFTKVHNDESLYSHIAQKAFKAMNDYTHSGANQVARNFNEEKGIIETTFEEELIVTMLKSIRPIISSLAIMYFEVIGMKQKELSETEVKDLITYLLKKENL